MSPSVSSIQVVAWLTIVLATLFVATAALVAESRRRFRRHRRIVQAVYDAGALPSEHDADAAARARTAIDMLGRAPSTLLWALAADASVPLDLQRLVAVALIGQHGPDRVRRRASRGRHWKRAAALRALVLARDPSAPDLLARSLTDPSPGVGRATVALLGQMDDTGSAELLAGVLRTGQQPRSRVATALDEFPSPVPHVVAPLLWSEDTQVRFWASALMRRYPDTPGLLERLVTLTSDESALVRKAAIDTLAGLADARAVRAVAPALHDDVPFVRAHAVRALGALGGASAASAIAERLADRDWWVRSAAKQALEQLGEVVATAVIPWLSHADRFARNGAAEVLQNTGVYARILVEEAQAPGDPVRRKVLTRLAAAGGQPMWNGHIVRVPGRIRVRARAIGPEVPASQR